jgi:hypothetical protein
MQVFSVALPSVFPALGLFQLIRSTSGATIHARKERCGKHSSASVIRSDEYFTNDIDRFFFAQFFGRADLPPIAESGAAISREGDLTPLKNTTA